MLQNAAQSYAGDMVRGGFFSHVSPSGSTLEQRIRQGTRYLAGALRYQIGEKVRAGVDLDRVHLFDAATESAIAKK